MITHFLEYGDVQKTPLGNPGKCAIYIICVFSQDNTFESTWAKGLEEEEFCF